MREKGEGGGGREGGEYFLAARERFSNTDSLFLFSDQSDWAIFIRGPNGIDEAADMASATPDNIQQKSPRSGRKANHG